MKKPGRLRRVSSIRASLWMLIVFLLCSCKSSNKSDLKDSEHGQSDFTFRSVGSRLDIIHKGDLEGNIHLDSLAKYPGLFGIGPLSGLRGEVTLYDGQAYIASLLEGKPAIDRAMDDQSAIFLAYANIDTWKEETATQPLLNQDAIASFVTEKADVLEFNLNTNFPFRVEGVADSLTYHIIYKEDNAPHNMQEHQKAKKQFTLTDVPIKIIGFWVDQSNEGVLTHPGKRIHLHFVTNDETTSGHIDGVSMRSGASIFLPTAILNQE